MYQYNQDPLLDQIRLDAKDARVVDVIHSNAGEGLGPWELYSIVQDWWVLF